MNKKIKKITEGINSSLTEVETSLKKLTIGPKKTIDELIAFVVKNKKWLIVTGIVYLIVNYLFADPKDEEMDEE